MGSRMTEVREQRPTLRARIVDEFPRVPAALGAARWACDCGRLHVLGTGKAGRFDVQTGEERKVRFGFACECGRTVWCVEQDRKGGCPLVTKAYRPPDDQRPRPKRRRLTMLEDPEITRQAEATLTTAIRWMLEQEQPEDANLNHFGFRKELRVGGGKYQYVSLSVGPSVLSDGDGIWVSASYAGTLTLDRDQHHELTCIVDAAAKAAGAKGVRRAWSGSGFTSWELAARAHPSAIKAACMASDDERKGGALVPPGWEH